MITTNFNKNLGDFDIAWPQRVSRHDLVYKAPPTDPMQYGMPIGNGDIGAILWCDDRKLYLALNKSDLFDDDAVKGMFYTSRHEENRTTLRHGCRIIIDFGTPIFDSFYLNDFNGRLHLKNGCIEFSLSGPFGSLSAKFFIAYNSNILCGEITTDFVEESGIEIALERYGSRTFSRWYYKVKRDPSIALDGTTASFDDQNIFVSHKLTTGEFVCALNSVGKGFKTFCKNSHISCAKAEKTPKNFYVFATVTTPLDKEHDKAAALKIIEEAKGIGFDKLLAENERCWKEFWEKSFVETDDDYLDNLWHLAMYYMCSCQRGRYPGRFINALWNWNRDVQPWNYYFHWNQQTAYWGLNAAGHHELCEPYLNYRFNSIPNAMEDAKNRFGLDDAIFISDVADRNGYNSCGEVHNHTPAGEIALDFWRQYEYTCDNEFLKEKAMPFMLGASRFLAACFEKRSDGKYHAIHGAAYEGWEEFSDVVTELAVTRTLLAATLKGLEILNETDKDQELWKDIVENIIDFPIIDCCEGFLSKNQDGTYTINAGKFKGATTKSSKILALGKYDGNAHKGQKTPIDYDSYANKYVPHFSVFDDGKEIEMLSGEDVLRSALINHSAPTHKKQRIARNFSGHPQACTAPVFPMNAIGIKDKGTELYDAAVTTALTIREANHAGFDPVPIALARLGEANAVDAYLYEFPTLWQYYNNGFGHYGPNPIFFADAHMPFRLDSAKDGETDEPMLFETFRFRHMGLEPMGVFSAIMNERLLQSFDGVIRIAPAYNKETAKFKLHAVGGFEVMAQIENGSLQFVAIKSLHGNELKLQNPWGKAYLDGKLFEDDLITLETVADKVYIFTQTADAEFNYAKQVPVENTEPKVRPDNITTLGTIRSF